MRKCCRPTLSIDVDLFPLWRSVKLLTSVELGRRPVDALAQLPAGQLG